MGEFKESVSVQTNDIANKFFPLTLKGRVVPE